MNKIWVVHDGYGCESGCCGHSVHSTNRMDLKFEFDHPFGVPENEWEAWAKEFASEFFNEGDFDWDACEISDD